MEQFLPLSFLLQFDILFRFPFQRSYHCFFREAVLLTTKDHCFRAASAETKDQKLDGNEVSANDKNLVETDDDTSSLQDFHLDFPKMMPFDDSANDNNNGNFASETKLICIICSVLLVSSGIFRSRFTEDIRD